MQGIADIFLSFFYFPGPAYPQYLLRPFCRPPTASSGAAVPIADENRRCTQRSVVFRCRIGCGNGSEVSGGRFRHDFSRKNMTDNVLQENRSPPLSGRCKTKRKPETREGFRLPVSYSAIICSTRQPISVRRPRCRRRSPF